MIRIRVVTKTLLSVLLLFCFTAACGRFNNLLQESGTILIVEVKTEEPNAEQITERAVATLKNRLNALGANGEVSKTTPNRIEIEIYGEADMQRIREILLSQSKFELRKAISPPSPAPLQTFPTKEAAMKSLGGAIPADRKVLPFSENDFKGSQQWVIVENPPIIDGNELRDAKAVSRTGGADDYQIAFFLKSSGAAKFGDWTNKNINNYLTIVLNDEVKSAAYIKSQIFDSGEISGRFTKQSAEDLALIMKSGYLPASFQIIEEKVYKK